MSDFRVKLQFMVLGVYKNQFVNNPDSLRSEKDEAVSSVQDIIDLCNQFAGENGYPVPEGATYQPKMSKLPTGHITGSLMLKNEKEVVEVITIQTYTPPPELTEEEKFEQQVAEEEDLATARLFRVWRKRLDKLKETHLSLKNNTERTPEEEAQYQQITGAINSVSTFLTDLQRVRPKNESTLNN